MTRHSINIDLPANITIGDMLTVKGALIDASTIFIDWAEMYENRHDGNHYPSHISSPGKILLAIAHQLGDQSREQIGD